jgi:hypothetical protein
MCTLQKRRDDELRKREELIGNMTPARRRMREEVRDEIERERRDEAERAWQRKRKEKRRAEGRVRCESSSSDGGGASGSDTRCEEGSRGLAQNLMR